MLAILLITLFALYLIFFVPIAKSKEDKIPEVRSSSQIKKLWQIAQSSMKDRRPLRAEKALLTILRFDEKNAAAYNRLGILYAKENQYDQAIECFEIAQSLDSNASSLHNAGLIYLETGAFEKASQAFKQAIAIEGDLPARYIAFAKAEEKLGHKDKALESLEAAFELERSTTILRHILDLHESAGDETAADDTKLRILNLIEEHKKSTPPPPKPKFPPKSPPVATKIRPIFSRLSPAQKSPPHQPLQSPPK
jgi:tetratricopeptide (TPR) repeat protein